MKINRFVGSDMSLVRAIEEEMLEIENPITFDDIASLKGAKELLNEAGKDQPSWRFCSKAKSLSDNSSSFTWQFFSLRSDSPSAHSRVLRGHQRALEGSFALWSSGDWQDIGCSCCREHERHSVLQLLLLRHDLQVAGRE